MAMTMAAPNLSQTTSSGTQSDFQTSSSPTTPSTNGLVVKAEVGCMTMTMPNGSSPMINCMSSSNKDGGGGASNNMVVSNNFDASTITNSNCTNTINGGLSGVGVIGGSNINGTIGGGGIGMSTMTTGINTSGVVIPSSNSVSTGTSTIGLEMSRKADGPGLIMNGSLSPSSGGGGGGGGGGICNTYSSCSTTTGVSVSATCQPIQGQGAAGSSVLINSQSVVPVSTQV